MSQRTEVRIDGARRALGWTPATSLARGMTVCEEWLRQEGYLPPAEAAMELPRASRVAG
jgi:nucleoside-diphosphate-sugar epimerase